MKPATLFPILVLACLPGFIDAQITFGAHGGIHTNKVLISGISDSWIPENSYWTGATAGFHMEVPLSSGLVFRPELNYTEKGFRVKEGFEFDLWNIPVPVGVEAITRVQYLEMPLLLKYTLTEGPVRPYLFGGPHLSYAVDGQVDLKAHLILDFNIASFDLDMTDNLYNQFEVGGIAGAGLAFDAGKATMFIQGSYQQGFTDMLDDPIVDIRLRNSGFNLTAGIQLPF